MAIRVPIGFVDRITANGRIYPHEVVDKALKEFKDSGRTLFVFEAERMAECIAERRLLSMTDALATVDTLSIVDNQIMAEIELLAEAKYPFSMPRYPVDEIFERTISHFFEFNTMGHGKVEKGIVTEFTLSGVSIYKLVANRDSRVPILEMR
jgi:hypothetical protein